MNDCCSHDGYLPKTFLAIVLKEGQRIGDLPPSTPTSWHWERVLPCVAQILSSHAKKGTEDGPFSLTDWGPRALVSFVRKPPLLMRSEDEMTQSAGWFLSVEIIARLLFALLGDVGRKNRPPRTPGFG